MAGSTRASGRPRDEAPAFLHGGDPRYWLGTDRLGRDLVARLVFGLRISVLVAIAGTILGSAAGIALGFVAAHFRGWVEEGIMMIVDFQASLPFILIALTLLAFFGNSLTLLVILMGLYGWDTYARLTRGVVLSAAAQPYVQALRSLGAGPLRIYLRHVLPNIAGPLIVQLTINFLQIILLETTLSFLGLGIQPPRTSLGQILGDGRDYLSSAWWISVLPGTVIVLTTLSMSLIGDWLRDRLDPMLRGQRP
jgi:peptide/nickel transport system permease protein